MQRSTRISILAAAASSALLAGALVLGTLTAAAASPHFKHGGEPVCTISTSGSSASVVCRGSITGLGNGDVLIKTTVSGFAVYQCQNPGGNLAPGQNRVLEGPSTTPTLIPSGEVKNGNLTFAAPGSLSAASTVSGNAAGCPNNSWTGVNPTLTVTSIQLVIEQPPGTQIFSCSASDPNGLTSPVALSC
jgi:hypothetical protein